MSQSVDLFSTHSMSSLRPTEDRLYDAVIGEPSPFIKRYQHAFVPLCKVERVRVKIKNRTINVSHVAQLTLRVHSSGDTVTPTRVGSISPDNKRHFTMQLDTFS